jgi:hypothetical protein
MVPVRTALCGLVFILALVVVGPATGSTPPTTSITVPTTPGQTVSVTWTGTIPPGENATSSCAGIPDALTDFHTTTVNVPAGAYDLVRARFTFTITWPSSVDDEILTVFEGPPNNAEIGSSDGGSNVETVVFTNLSAGPYTSVACPFASGTATNYTGKLEITTTSPVSSPGVTNVGLASDQLVFDFGPFLDDTRVAFQVSEFEQGDSDLNGDGDASDQVLHVFDAARGRTTNVGLATSHFALDAFLVSEFDQGGSDLNGDGDAFDQVLHVFDAARGRTTNVGLASESGFRFDGTRIVFSVFEGAQGGSDLNGDGDAFDQVLHVFDAARGTTTNVGLATDFFSPELDGTRVAVRVPEAEQGGSDLNGDGDAFDHVPHVFDAARGRTTNVGLASAGGGRLDGTRLAFEVSEFRQGGSDLNGDGDVSDQVLHVFDAARGRTTNVGLASFAGFELNGTRVAVMVDEGDQGDSDLNGDGDTTDFCVLHVFDAASGRTTNVGLASECFFDLVGTRVAFHVLEGDQGDSDLNGDGDAFDRALHLFDAASGRTTNVGLASGFGTQLDGMRVAFDVGEGDQGDSDLNGDGDAFDLVLHVFDAASGRTTNVGLAGGFRLDGTRVAFIVGEADQGDSDLNGDGDAFDLVLHVFDAARGRTTNVGLASRFPLEFDGTRVAFNVGEADQGRSDLNGDGDRFDQVLHVFDVRRAR